jgi:hypothetical protein
MQATARNILLHIRDFRRTRHVGFKFSKGNNSVFVPFLNNHMKFVEISVLRKAAKNIRMTSREFETESSSRLFFFYVILRRVEVRIEV